MKKKHLILIITLVGLLLLPEIIHHIYVELIRYLEPKEEYYRTGEFVSSLRYSIYIATFGGFSSFVLIQLSEYIVEERDIMATIVIILLAFLSLGIIGAVVVLVMIEFVFIPPPQKTQVLYLAGFFGGFTGPTLGYFFLRPLRDTS